jgi:hypothetical protein
MSKCRGHASHALLLCAAYRHCEAPSLAEGVIQLQLCCSTSHTVTRKPPNTGQQQQQQQKLTTGSLMSQILTTPSSSPDAKRLPFEDHATQLTACLCPTKSRRCHSAPLAPPPGGFGAVPGLLVMIGVPAAAAAAAWAVGGASCWALRCRF